MWDDITVARIVFMWLILTVLFIINVLEKGWDLEGCFLNSLKKVFPIIVSFDACKVDCTRLYFV